MTTRGPQGPSGSDSSGTSGADARPEPTRGPRLLVDPQAVPSWLAPLVGHLDGVTDVVARRGGTPMRLLSALPGRRQAAVLVLFSGAADPSDPTKPGPDAQVVLTQRAATLRNHSGQVAFPGGSRDEGEDYPVGTALREAAEEAAIDPETVTPLALTGSLAVPPSGFDVVPVISYWDRPHDIRAVDAGETERVARVRLHDLLDPANRFQVRRTVLGGRAYQGPAFGVDGLLVWGFTGGLLAAMTAVAGWDIPWDHDDVRDLAETLDGLEYR
ncbi:CoA pyrophosphatase [Gordonia jinhuaensis]|uniref:Nudix hydrolase domain-containing protein n=1 Tax=Gordonia jinhuaensis TaxID=1517702 RepID=A0A916T8A8_9ACTN|nr:CoA pyrophosphatase [Gordonia jinhuaensis]GGB35634.1 hypothetical protein GCM10011489_24600 [Gordonia jinhuaensis]